MLGIQMHWYFPRQPQDLDDATYEQINFKRKHGSIAWWFPMGISPQDMVTLSSLNDVIPFLKSIPQTLVNKMLKAVAQERPKFIYKWEWMGRPAANRIVLDNICHFVGKHCSS
eukprot:jgi/Botrbrau1/2719/Bobra.0203s0061.1